MLNDFTFMLVSCSKYIEFFWQRILDLFMDIDTGTLYSFLNNWIIIDLQHSVSSWWSDSYMHCKITTMVILFTIWHYTKLLQYYWLYPPCCVFHAYGSFILPLKFCTFNLPHPFHSLPHPSLLWQLPVCSLYLWVCSYLVMFVLPFCFSDFTCKWNHMVFVFL